MNSCVFPLQYIFLSISLYCICLILLIMVPDLWGLLGIIQWCGMDAMLLGFCKQYSLICVLVLALALPHTHTLFHSLQVFCTCSDLIVWAGSWELPGGSGCVCAAVGSWLPLDCFPKSLEFLGVSTCVLRCVAYELCSLLLWVGSSELWAESTQAVTLNSNLK